MAVVIASPPLSSQDAPAAPAKLSVEASACSARNTVCDPRPRASGRRRSFSFPKRRRILKSPDFRLVGRAGQRRQGELLIVDILAWRNPRRPTQLGLTVSRKYGDAVERNRFKRLVREAFRKHQHLLPPAQGCVVSPRSAAKTASAAQIENELIRLVRAAPGATGA